MFVKLYVGPTFDKSGFVDLLREQMGVKCAAVDDGIILNRDEFNAWPGSWVPVWAWLNKPDINSALHTRPARTSEILLCK